MAFKDCQISSYRNLQSGLVKGLDLFIIILFPDYPSMVFLYLNKDVILQINVPIGHYKSNEIEETAHKKTLSLRVENS